MNFYTSVTSPVTKSWADIQEEEEERIKTENKDKSPNPPLSDKKIFNKSNDRKNRNS